MKVRGSVGIVSKGVVGTTSEDQPGGNVVKQKIRAKPACTTFASGDSAERRIRLNGSRRFAVSVSMQQKRDSHLVEHRPGRVGDGLHAKPRVAELVSERLLQAADVSHEPLGRPS